MKKTWVNCALTIGLSLVLLIDSSPSYGRNDMEVVPVTEETKRNLDFISDLYQHGRLVFETSRNVQIGVGASLVAGGYLIMSLAGDVVWKTVPGAVGLVGVLLLSKGIYRFRFEKDLDLKVVSDSYPYTIADHFILDAGGAKKFFRLLKEDRSSALAYMTDPRLQIFVNGLVEAMKNDPSLIEEYFLSAPTDPRITN